MKIIKENNGLRKLIPTNENDKIIILETNEIADYIYPAISVNEENMHFYFNDISEEEAQAYKQELPEITE